MTLPSSGTIKMSEIIAEKGATAGSSAINISLRGLSVDGISDYQAAGSQFLIDIPVSGSSPDQTAPHRMSEFYGYSQTLATTYDNSLSENEYSVDSNIIVRPQLRIQYASGNINVNWYPDSENPSPADGTLVYQIVNPASGYTVRETSTDTGDGANYWTYSNIQPNGSAVSVPTSTFYTDWQPSFESGGSYDQPGQNISTLTVSLIFEKSGETTFTYNFTLDVEIETAGEGGQ
jgi:hypothetical protein